MKKVSFISHAAAAVIVSILTGLIYVSVQQSHRSAANDPQLQVAMDMKDRLENNGSIEPMTSGDTVEISRSSAVFKVLYNQNGNPIQSNGLLDGKLPRIPRGVLDFTKKNGEDVLTWQPRKGVRMAMVIESVQSPAVAFVAAGRSLKEVEKRVSNLTTMLLIGWLGCLGVIIVHGLSWSLINKNQ